MREEREGGAPTPSVRRVARALTHKTTLNNTVAGVLKGYDQLLNLVLDEAREYLRGEPPAIASGDERRPGERELCPPPNSCTLTPPDAHAPTPPPPRQTKQNKTKPDPEDPSRVTDKTRSLGLVVCRGTAVMVVSPTQGAEEVANPFAEAVAT